MNWIKKSIWSRTLSKTINEHWILWVHTKFFSWTTNTSLFSLLRTRPDNNNSNPGLVLNVLYLAILLQLCLSTKHHNYNGNQSTAKKRQKKWESKSNTIIAHRCDLLKHWHKRQNVSVTNKMTDDSKTWNQ